MRPSYSQFNGPQFRVLSDKQIEELHLATLQILERTGVTFECQEALQLLGDAGADISNPDRVKIPSYLVEKALETVPKTITIYTRDGEPAFVLNGMTGSHFGAGHDPRFIHDVHTGKIRKCYVEDIVEYSRVIDALPNIEWSLSAAVNLTLPTTTDDISDRIGILQFILNSSKPVAGSNNNVSTLRETIELCAIVAGGEEQLRKKPFFINTCEPVTPLIQGEDSMQRSLLCAEKGVPSVVYGMQMAGATTPATFPGCIAIANAEVLSQLVVLQLKNPGAPFIYGGMPSIMDMKTTIYSYGAPEKILMVAALTELCHHYKLPMYGTAGCTDAQKMNIQAAVEGTSTIFASALSGADLVHNVGTLYHGGWRSLEFTVLADEIIDMVRVIMNGIEINEDTLPLDLIEKKGPKANYLSEAHTRKYFRRFWVPTVFDRSASKKEDEKDCEELLKAKTLEILKTHQPRPLPDDVVKELRKMEKSWLKRVGLTDYPKREL
ncbi:trimethylamine methyltransferase family protein [Chloroflexota bacterium]